MNFNAQSSPGFALGRTAHLLRSATAAVLKQASWPLSPEETQTLIILADAGQPLSMSELASRMVRDATTVKRQLDELVEREFVERRASGEDARIVMVGLTTRGKKQLDAVLPVLSDLRETAMKGVSKHDLEVTTNVLQRMQRNLTERR